MRVEHFEKGLQYTDKDLLAVARKIGRLATLCSRLKDEASVIRVEAEQRPTKKARDEVKVMVTVELPHKVLRAESRRADAVDALDRCVEKLEPQLERYKDKHIAFGKKRQKLRGRQKDPYTLAA